jgi:ribosome recycling factor
MGVPGTKDPETIEEKMSRALQAMERDFARLRTGAASASLLDDVHVDHRGRRARLVEVASITVPDPRQIVIAPWDPSMLRAIGAAISHSRIGLTPTVDGPAIRLYVPGMTEERRREIVQLVQKRMGRASVDIRALRHEALATVKSGNGSVDDIRRETARLQQITDRYIAEIDRLGRLKQASVMRLQ